MNDIVLKGYDIIPPYFVLMSSIIWHVDRGASRPQLLKFIQFGAIALLALSTLIFVSIAVLDAVTGNLTSRLIALPVLLLMSAGAWILGEKIDRSLRKRRANRQRK